MASMFEKGVVSVWLGVVPGESDENIDVLKDLCGVEYYDIDFGEANTSDDSSSASVEELIRSLSYSGSFILGAVEAARRVGISQAHWVTVQYDFRYDATKTVRPIAPDPVFIGCFPYSTDTQS